MPRLFILFKNKHICSTHGPCPTKVAILHTVYPTLFIITKTLHKRPLYCITVTFCLSVVKLN